MGVIYFTKLGKMNNTFLFIQPLIYVKSSIFTYLEENE